MTTINDIMDYFETFAPLGTAMEFDNCGLLVGEKNAEIANVLLALDITAEVADEAEQLGCELIISHHPVIFHPMKKLDAGSVPYLLARKSIAALCMHTNLDLSEMFGVNVCLGTAVGLSDVKKSEIGECLFYGELDKEMTLASFAQSVKAALGCDGLRYTDNRKAVRKIAVSSGAGGSNIFAAAELGADALLTGEAKHHEINAANELGVAVVDVGHYKSEDIVIKPLADRLKKEFPEIGFTKSSIYRDKVKYIS